MGRVRESLAKTTKLAVTADAAEVHSIQDTTLKSTECTQKSKQNTDNLTTL